MFKLRKDIAEMHRENEHFWQQRSCEDWGKYGDKNTIYFQNVVKGKKARNQVLFLRDDEGREHYQEGSKGKIAADYFQNLFKCSNPGNANFEPMFVGFAPRVSEQMNAMLTSPISKEEVHEAVMSIKGSRAPGPDGFTGAFYQRFWGVVGPTFTQEIMDFFNSAVLPIDWNRTNICLIPKVVPPTRMTELRPISLCLVHYKIISKIMCSRLKAVLPEIISDTQGAFVSERLISDNILVAHEMLHALRTYGPIADDYMAIKTDMSKAYDRVEWGFIQKIMEKMGFSETWIAWIMACVKSVTYTVLLNGRSHGFIKPKREGLVHILNTTERSGRLSGIRFDDTGPAVHHLLFADDSLLLCKATGEEAMTVHNCLRLYEQASGQAINFSKSSICFGVRVDDTRKRTIQRILHITKVGGDGVYLGLPECFKGSKRELLKFIHEKLQNRLQGWYAKSLSQGGKEVLLKSIALDLPVYAMSCFKLPVDIINKLTSAMTQFWWSSGDKRRKIPWVAWQQVCRRKDEGGIGFHDIAKFNQALLCKQAWRIWSRPLSLLSRVLKSRYFSRSSFLECGKGSRTSYAWQSIIHGRKLLEEELLKSIGNGRDTWVWTDKWILNDNPRPPVSRQRDRDVMLKVSDLFIPHTALWDVGKVRRLFTTQDAELILNMKTSLSVSDSFVWGFTKEGVYTSQSGYRFLEKQPVAGQHPQNQATPIEKKVWNQIWRMKTLPKIRHFLWRVLHGALAVPNRLQTRGIYVNQTCKWCNNDVETISHILFTCPVADQVWHSVGIPHPPMGFSRSVVFPNIHYIIQCSKNPAILQRIRQAIPWFLWRLWKSRNLHVFEGAHYDAHAVEVKAIEDADIWFQVNRTEPHPQRVLPMTEVSSTWQKPKLRELKCNIGVSWINPIRNCGASWVVRDHMGLIKVHGRRSFSKVSSAVEAVFLSLCWAVESIRYIHLTQVIFELTDRNVTMSLKNTSLLPAFRQYIAEIHGILNAIQGWKVAHVATSSNMVAQAIAESATNTRLFQSYVANSGPVWLQHLISMECQDATE